jgi:hypothetical protein
VTWRLPGIRSTLALSQREREGPDREAVGRVRVYALTTVLTAPCRHAV